MSKGIFIIPEVPPCCLRCPFEVCGEKNYYCNLYESITVSLKPISLSNRQEKPDWCPIKTAPEKKPKMKQTVSPMLTEQYEFYDKGWNDCIDEILRRGEM